jgi:hypothetical protein
LAQVQDAQIEIRRGSAFGVAVEFNRPSLEPEAMGVRNALKI